MVRIRKRNIVGMLLLAVLSGGVLRVHAATQPRVRAITGFVHLERAQYEKQIAAALLVLRAAKRELEDRGYEVETLRIVTQPLGELVRGASDAQAFDFLTRLDALAARESFVPSVGPAMLRDDDDPRTLQLLARSLASLPNIEGNAVFAAEDGIHWRVIRESAKLVRYVAEHHPASGGDLNFTGIAMVKPYGPFFPGTYHDGEGQRFSVGLESAGLVQEVFARMPGDFSGAGAELTRVLTVHAKAVEAASQKVASVTGWRFMGVDTSPAPLGDVSIGAAMESYTGARFGSSGTLTAALVITTAVKAVPVTQVGFSGLMIPVMEDTTLARRWAEGVIKVDSLLAYSAVCGTGLDAIPLPGDVTEDQLGRIFGDVASLAWKWKKPLTARVLPVQGKTAGEVTGFTDRYLFNTTLQGLP